MIKWPARDKGQTPEITGAPNEPWWTRAAIAWMENNLTPEMDVVEWGAGASTPWIAARCRRLRSIESNPEFCRLAAAALREAGRPADQYTVELQPLNPKYYECVTGEYDAAVVDGRLRVECCARAMELLKPGGILLLDNSERKEYERARRALTGWAVVETYNGMWHTNIWRKPNAI